jgi:hypothetical protein
MWTITPNDAHRREPMDQRPENDGAELYGVWQNTVRSDENRQFTFGRAHGGKVACNRVYDTVHDIGICELEPNESFVFTIRGAEDDKETWRYQRSGTELLLNDMRFVAVAGADVETELTRE